MTDTDNIVPLPDMKKLEAEAAEWLMRLEGGEMSDADHAAFAAWKGESELNREALERYARLWGGLDALEELNDYAPVGARPARASTRLSRARVFPALAAAFALVFAAGAFLSLRFLDADAGRYAGQFETVIGRQQTIDLPDGSRITLNTDSQVEVDYGKNARRIHLVRGEAYFEVAPNKKKPFSVYAANGVVTAVGTAFTVRLRQEKLDVTVSEGRVALSSADDALEGAAALQRAEAAPEAVVELTAGQNALYDEGVEALEHVTQAEMDRKLSWRKGMLAFAGEPLSAVVEEVGRYSSVKIDIEDENLRDLPIAGYFKTGEVDALIEALQLMANVKVERLSPDHVMIVAADAG